MTNIDLKLLAIIHELNKTRSVSQAAENLKLSQSAVSMSLAKLRRQFNDPLLVRTSRGMTPTPYAAALFAELKKAESILHAALEYRAAFDPLTSDRMFHLCSTDIAQFTVLPPLMQTLKSAGPSIRIVLRNIPRNLPRLLESGEADLAIGLLPQLGAGFCQQKLYDGQFVCAMRADHPRIKNVLTREQYESEIHLSATTSGTGYQMLEETLQAQRIQRLVGVRVPSFLGVAGIIAVTDLLAIIPKRLGAILAEGRNMTLLPLPFDVPSYTVTQVWHERYSLDPAHQWLRSIVAGLFKRESSAAAPRKRR